MFLEALLPEWEEDLEAGDTASKSERGRAGGCYLPRERRSRGEGRKFRGERWQQALLQFPAKECPAAEKRRGWVGGQGGRERVQIGVRFPGSDEQAAGHYPRPCPAIVDLAQDNSRVEIGQDLGRGLGQSQAGQGCCEKGAARLRKDTKKEEFLALERGHFEGLGEGEGGGRRVSCIEHRHEASSRSCARHALPFTRVDQPSRKCDLRQGVSKNVEGVAEPGWQG